MNCRNSHSPTFWSSVLIPLFFVTAADVFAQAPGTILWEFETAGEIRSSPAIAEDGSIYFGSRDGNLYAVTRSGKQKWTFLTAGFVDAAPAIGSDGTIYVGSADGKLYAVGADGKQRWQFEAGSPITEPVAIAPDGTVYVNAKAGTLYSLNSNGSKKWEFRTGGVQSGAFGTVVGGVFAPSIGPDGEILVYYYDGTDSFLYALNSDGTRRWRINAFIGASCVIDTDGTVYARAGQSLLVRSPNGSVKFYDPFPSVPTIPPGPGVSDMSIGERNTLIISRTGSPSLAAVFPDGTVRWGSARDGSSATTPAVASDGTIYVGDNLGFLRAVSGTGELLWRTDMRGQIVAPPTLGADGTIYVGSINKRLLAIKGTTGLAKSAWPMYRRDAKHSGAITRPPVQVTALDLHVYAGVAINGNVGSTYRIEVSEKVPDVWKPLATVTLDRTPFLFFDIESTNVLKRFYRAVAVP